MPTILGADIGGTSSRFARFRLGDDGELKLEEKVWLETAKAGSFEELLQQVRSLGFIKDYSVLTGSAFAVAGAIRDGKLCSPPNIKWEIDLDRVKSKVGITRAILLNDFLAQAFACRSPLGREAQTILEGTSSNDGAIAVVGAGTGLGKAILYPTGGRRYIGMPSEGGHAQFAAENESELKFIEFVKAEVGGKSISWEDTLSGRGLVRVHQFLTGEKLEPREVAAGFDKHPETLKWVSRIYARVCRNFALEVLATGGVYIAGGVAAKNPQLLTNPEFRDHFHESRVYRKLLEQIPVHLVKNEDSGLWGAGFYAAQEFLGADS